MNFKAFLSLHRPSARRVLFAAAALIIAAAGVGTASAQRRDYMTDAEIELVRENQDLDLRIDTLIKMIDRRFANLKIDVQGWTPPAKESQKWGAEPTGTRREMLSDVKLLLQKAVDDINDVSEHDALNGPQDKKKAPLFPKALRMLAAAVRRYAPALDKLISAVPDAERGLILDSLDLSDQITQAAAGLPPDPKKSKSR